MKTETTAQHGRPETVIYPYVDDAGQIAFEAVRIVYSNHAQCVQYRRPSGEVDGSWLWGLEAGEFMRTAPGKNWFPFHAPKFEQYPATRERKIFTSAAPVIPYQLQELLKTVAAGRAIFICKDEDEADFLRSRGLCATCCARGIWGPEHAAFLRGANVVLAAGRDHAKIIAQSLNSIARRVRILESDVVLDLRTSGNTEKFIACIAAAPDHKKPSQLKVHTGGKTAASVVIPFPAGNRPDPESKPDRPKTFEPNFDEAERFLTALDPNTNEFTFQTFDDNRKRKDGRLAKILHGTLAQHWDTLVKLNERGAGIYICVNVTDFKGRSTKNIVGVRSHFGDLDGALLEPVLAPGEPKTHIITETSSGRWQVYWRVVNAPLDQFGTVQKAIAARYNGDKAVHDLPRVMRLPGFIHRKGVPFRSRLVQASDHEPYEWSEFCKAFSPKNDSSDQLDLTRKSASNNSGEAPNNFPVAPEFADLPVEDLGEGIETYSWWDRLSPEQKDAALDHGLELIAKNSDLLKFGNNDNWFRIVTTVARSGAPHLEDIFVKHARTVPGADSEEELRRKLAYCKNPRTETADITVGTFIKWARQHGANFEPWLETYQSTIEPAKVKQRYEPVNRDAPELAKLDAAWVTRIFEGNTDGKYQNDLAFAVACELVRVKLDDQFIARVLMTTPCGVYVQESPPYRLNRTIRRAHEFAIDPDLEKMNSQHAVLPMGGKTRVVTWGDDPEFPGRKTIVWAQTLRDFRDLHSNKRKQVGTGKSDDDDKPTTKSIQLGAWWLAQRRRRQYDGGQRFMPQHEAEVVGDVLNMFQGFPIQPRKPNGRSGASGCNLFLDHGRKIICSGDEEHWNYLLNREAWIAQHRGRSEIAVALRSDAEGAGKGFWCNHLGRLYGPHYMQVNKPEHVVGKHNPHLETLLKLCADEALFVGSHLHRNALFSLITEPTLTIEPKFVGVYKAPNFLNTDLISNSKHFVPATHTARRLFIPTVSENKVGDLAYFNDVTRQLQNGGYEALLYHLLHEVNLRDFDVRKVPKTAGLAEQIELSRKGIDGLVEKICNEAAVPCPHEEWPGFSVSTGYEKREGFDFLIATHPDRELRDLGPLKVKRELRNNWKCKTGEDAQRRDGDELIRGIKWPQLAELRKLFVTRHGPQDWLNPEITEWQINPPADPRDYFND